MARDASKDRTILLFVVLLQTFAYFVPAATWNPVSRLAATRAFASGRLEVGSFAAATGDRSWRRGRWYSDKAPLPAMVAAPTYALVRAVHRALHRDAPAFEAREVRGVTAASLTPNTTFTQLLYASSLMTAGLAGASLAVLVLRFLRRRFAEPVAMTSTLATIFGTPLFPYSTSFYGHVPAALALFGAVCALDVEPEARVPPKQLALVGFLLAFAVGCEYLTAVPAAVVGGYAIVRAARASRTSVFALALGAFAPVVAIGAYHAACFGSPLRTGYSFLVNPTFVAGHGRGLLGLMLPRLDALIGLFVGPSRGLFRLAPVALVGVVGLALRVRRVRDPVVVVAVLSAVAMGIANAGYYMWWGGAATGPRHLVPVMPVLAVGIAHVLTTPRLRVGGLVLACVSIASMLAFTAIGLEAPEGQDVVVDYLAPHLARGEFAWLRGSSNLGLMLGFARPASLVPLLAFWILAGYSLREGRPDEPEAAHDETAP